MRRKPFQRLRGGGCLRPLQLLADGGGGVGQATRAISVEAAGGGVGGCFAVAVQAGLGQLDGEQPREVVAGLGLHPRGNFLGAEFEEEVGHTASPRA